MTCLRCDRPSDEPSTVCSDCFYYSVQHTYLVPLEPHDVAKKYDEKSRTALPSLELLFLVVTSHGSIWKALTWAPGKHYPLVLSGRIERALRKCKQKGLVTYDQKKRLWFPTNQGLEVLKAAEEHTT